MATSTAICNALFSSVIVATTIFTLPCDFHIQVDSLLLHSIFVWDYTSHRCIAIMITHSNWRDILGLARSVVGISYGLGCWSRLHPAFFFYQQVW